MQALVAADAEAHAAEAASAAAAAGPARSRKPEVRRPPVERHYSGPAPGPRPGEWVRDELIVNNRVAAAMMGRHGDQLGRISRETGAEIKVGRHCAWGI